MDVLAFEHRTRNAVEIAGLAIAHIITCMEIIEVLKIYDANYDVINADIFIIKTFTD